MSQRPTFLVVGAAKSGTTTLHYFMEQHPEVCVPTRKETYVFNRRSMEGTWPPVDPMDEAAYLAQFSENTTERTRAWGEVTTSNLFYHEEAVPEIKRIVGDPKIIILIRNPIDRAYSNWTYASASYGEPHTFEEAIRDEARRVEMKVQFMGLYVRVGFYFEAVKHFLSSFSNHKVYILEDLKQRGPEMVSEIFEFIGVDSSFAPDLETTYNPSGIPRSRLLQKFVFRDDGVKGAPVQRAMRMVMGRDRADRLFHTLRVKNLKRVPMNPETRRELAEVYRDDVLKLQDLLGRDLSHWLKV
jgi:hypothetical protein